MMIKNGASNAKNNELKITSTGFIKKFQGTENIGNSCYFQTAIRLFACHPVWMYYLKLLYESGLAQQPSEKNGKIDSESAQTKECFLRKLYELVTKPEINDVNSKQGEKTLQEQKTLFQKIYTMYQKITHNIHNGLNDQGSCNETIRAITDIINEAVVRKKVLGLNEKNELVYDSLYPSYLADEYNIPLDNNGMSEYCSFNPETIFSLSGGRQPDGCELKCLISKTEDPFYTGRLITKTFNDIVMLSDVAVLFDPKNGRVHNAINTFSVRENGEQKGIDVDQNSKIKDIKKVFFNGEEYTLACFAKHTGSLNSGHYTAFVYDDINNDQLTNFDDGGQNKYNEDDILIGQMDHAMYIKTDALNKGKINISMLNNREILTNKKDEELNNRIMQLDAEARKYAQAFNKNNNNGEINFKGNVIKKQDCVNILVDLEKQKLELLRTIMRKLIEKGYLDKSELEQNKLLDKWFYDDNNIQPDVEFNSIEGDSGVSGRFNCSNRWKIVNAVGCIHQCILGKCLRLTGSEPKDAWKNQLRDKIIGQLNDILNAPLDIYTHGKHELISFEREKGLLLDFIECIGDDKKLKYLFDYGKAPRKTKHSNIKNNINRLNIGNTTDIQDNNLQQGNNNNIFQSLNNNQLNNFTNYNQQNFNPQNIQQDNNNRLNIDDTTDIQDNTTNIPGNNFPQGNNNSIFQSSNNNKQNFNPQNIRQDDNNRLNIVNTPNIQQGNNFQQDNNNNIFKIPNNNQLNNFTNNNKQNFNPQNIQQYNNNRLNIVNTPNSLQGNNLQQDNNNSIFQSHDNSSQNNNIFKNIQRNNNNNNPQNIQQDDNNNIFQNFTNIQDNDFPQNNNQNNSSRYNDIFKQRTTNDEIKTHPASEEETNRENIFTEYLRKKQVNNKPPALNTNEIFKRIDERRKRSKERREWLKLRLRRRRERLRKIKEKNERIRRQRLEQKKIIDDIKELFKKIRMVEEYYKKKYKRIDNGRTRRLLANVTSAIRKVMKS